MDCLKLLHEYLLKVKSTQEIQEYMSSAANVIGSTLLHIACDYGHEHIVRYLIDVANVDTTKSNSRQETAMDIAERKGHDNIVSILSNTD